MKYVHHIEYSVSMKIYVSFDDLPVGGVEGSGAMFV